jgi:GWxTD domain-containing protein
MRGFFLRLFISAFLALAFSSCEVTRRAYNQDLSDMYKPETAMLHPQLQVFNVSDAVSDIYYSLDSKELLYSKGLNSDDFSAFVYITYLLTPSYESRVVLDSGTVKVSDVNKDNARKFIQGKFQVKTPALTSYLLKVTFHDVHRAQEFDRFVELFKGHPGSFQYFFVSKEPGVPLFRTTVSGKESVSISYPKAPKGKLFVKYFKRDFPVATPPFTTLEPPGFGYKADSLFVLQLSDSGSVAFQPLKPGIYNFSKDSIGREGLTLYRFYDGFPEITKADQMVYPLRYITSKEEYDEIFKSKNKKLAVENFWVNCAGGKDRGKEMIRKYYTRVKEANIYFSSYLEGWKTDRGMIFLIFGPPNVVYRATDRETWVYGEESNVNALSFIFDRMANPFTDNDYSLQRSVDYKTNWFREVDDVWRQGRTYLQN